MGDSLGGRGAGGAGKGWVGRRSGGNGRERSCTSQGGSWEGWEGRAEWERVHFGRRWGDGLVGVVN